MKRSFNYLTTKTLQGAASVVLSTMFIFFIPMIFAEIGMEPAPRYDTINYFFLLIISTFTICQSMITYSPSTNVAIKYGTTRKIWYAASFYSKLLYTALISLAIVILLNPISVLISSTNNVLYNVNLLSMILLIFVCYASNGLGYIVGLIMVKLGKYGITAGVLALLSIYFTFLIPMLDTGKGYIEIKIIDVPSISFIIIMAAAGLAAEFVNWLLLRRYSVSA